MMIEICKDFRNSCTGCGACIAACPKRCVSMRRDREGFDFPKIDVDACVSCGRCAAACPNNADPVVSSLHRAWAFQEADGAALESSSGGAFHALALDMLACGGTVYGFAFEGVRLAMKRATDEATLAELRGSKYVQGTIGDAYRAISADAVNGVSSLICGVPCQIAGVASLLTAKDRERTLLVDLACHGVPSPGLFEEHASWLASKSGSPLAETSFRDKRYAHWLVSKHFRYRFQNGSEKHGNWKADPFYNAYLKGSTMRECCYRCRYATLGRASDITLADFWGLGRVPQGMRLREGISAVVAHTERGVCAAEALESRGALVSADVEDVVEGNPNLVRPTRRPEARDTAYRDIEDEGYGVWARRQVTARDRFVASLFDVVPSFAVAALVSLRDRMKGAKRWTGVTGCLTRRFS